MGESWLSWHHIRCIRTSDSNDSLYNAFQSTFMNVLVQSLDSLFPTSSLNPHQVSNCSISSDGIIDSVDDMKALVGLVHLRNRCAYWLTSLVLQSQLVHVQSTQFEAKETGESSLDKSRIFIELPVSGDEHSVTANAIAFEKCGLLKALLSDPCCSVRRTALDVIARTMDANAKSLDAHARFNLLCCMDKSDWQLIENYLIDDLLSHRNSSDENAVSKSALGFNDANMLSCMEVLLRMHRYRISFLKTTQEHFWKYSGNAPKLFQVVSEAARHGTGQLGNASALELQSHFLRIMMQSYKTYDTCIQRIPLALSQWMSTVTSCSSHAMPEAVRYGCAVAINAAGILTATPCMISETGAQRPEQKIGFEKLVCSQIQSVQVIVWLLQDDNESVRHMASRTALNAMNLEKSCSRLKQPESSAIAPSLITSSVSWDRSPTQVLEQFVSFMSVKFGDHDLWIAFMADLLNANYQFTAEIAHHSVNSNGPSVYEKEPLNQYFEAFKLQKIAMECLLSQISIRSVRTWELLGSWADNFINNLVTSGMSGSFLPSEYPSCSVGGKSFTPQSFASTSSVLSQLLVSLQLIISGRKQFKCSFSINDASIIRTFIERIKPLSHPTNTTNITYFANTTGIICVKAGEEMWHPILIDLADRIETTIGSLKPE
jgi:hypothetical protein